MIMTDDDKILFKGGHILISSTAHPYACKGGFCEEQESTNQPDWIDIDLTNISVCEACDTTITGVQWDGQMSEQTGIFGINSSGNYQYFTEDQYQILNTTNNIEGHGSYIDWDSGKSTWFMNLECVEAIGPPNGNPSCTYDGHDNSTGCYNYWLMEYAVRSCGANPVTGFTNSDPAFQYPFSVTDTDCGDLSEKINVTEGVGY